jgi:hypothetical protein
MELHASITCLRNSGIDSRNAVIGQACAPIWVRDEDISAAVKAQRNAGFQATVLTETDVLN